MNNVVSIEQKLELKKAIENAKNSLEKIEIQKEILLLSLMILEAEYEAT